MNLSNLTKATFLSAAVFLQTGFWGRAQEAPKLLPFQGRLTDARGAAVADGSKLILFEIYEVPTGGNATWPGEMHKTTVNGGLVNVLLGSKSPFGATSPDFNKTLYLQITIDANGDNAITSADPPLLPRQVILPAVFAKEAATSREAADSEKLGGYPLDQLPNAIPVGGIVMWWGKTSEVPAGFELCDGTPPKTPEAKLQGAKPDLRDRFVKGAINGAVDVKTAPVLGGANTIAQRDSGETILSVDQIPKHKHTITDPGHSHSIQAPPNLLAAAGPTYGVVGNIGATRSSIDKTGITATEETGAGQGHKHAIPAQDNRPSFLELFFIIRVK